MVDAKARRIEGDHEFVVECLDFLEAARHAFLSARQLNEDLQYELLEYAKAHEELRRGLVTAFRLGIDPMRLRELLLEHLSSELFAKVLAQIA